MPNTPVVVGDGVVLVLPELLEELELFEPLELLEPEELEPEALETEELEPEELELPDELLDPLPLLALLALTLTVALVGEPKPACPATLVSAMSNILPAAKLVTGTLTVLTPVSPSLQVTVPLVAT
jgi:hypothetical protein